MLLANHPVMVPDAIRELVAKQEDMEVVGDCRGPMKILQEAGRTKADVVIFFTGRERGTRALQPAIGCLSRPNDHKYG